MVERISRFFKEVYIEVKKVTWPPKRETIASTLVVIIIVLIIAFFLGLVDLVLARVIRIFLR